MPMRVIDVRHHTAPEPNGCRWCGVGGVLNHAIRWVPSVGTHTWTAPTDAQRKARMLARRKEATR